MSLDISRIVDVLKSPRLSFAVCIACGAALAAPDVLPEGLAARTQLPHLVESGGLYLAIAFLLCASVLLLHLGSEIWRWTTKRLQWRTNEKRLKAGLRRLTPEEKALLRDCYLRYQSRSALLPVTDGVVNGLVAAGIIYRAANLGHHDSFAFNLQPWAWDELQAHPGACQRV